MKTPAPDEFYEKAAPELRPSFVRTMDSTNVLIEGVRFVGSSMWTIHLLYTDNAVVRNVIIEAYPGVHTDGIAVDSSRNVRISDCYIDAGDDGIVLKSGKDADGRRVNRPTENVSIANCTVHHAHGAVTLGSEIAGGIRNVVAEQHHLSTAPRWACASRAGADGAAWSKTSGSTTGRWKTSARPSM